AMNALFRPSIALFCLAALSGCTEFYGPPEVNVVGLEGKRLDDPRAPIEIAFSKPIDPSTLKLSIAYNDHDIERNLLDEQTPPQPLRTIFEHNPEWSDFGGSSELLDGNRLFRIDLLAAPPVGPEFVVAIEPGLMDADRRASTKTRIRIPFAYDFR